MLMIDVLKVQEAQKTIRQAEKDLCFEVKKYLEENPTFRREVKNKEELSSRLESELEWVYVTLNNVQLRVELHRSEADGDWSYTISCEKLEIYNLTPLTQNALNAQGELLIQYSGPDNLFAERKIQLRKYFA